VNRRPVPLTLATGALLTSVGFIASSAIRDASPVYGDLGGAVYLWHALFLVGGVSTIWGVRFLRPKAEAAGLTLVSGGGLFYVVGAFVARGFAAWTAGTLIGAASIAMLLRVYALTKGRPWS
jgi:predicted membrane channel-forming protein YqfA (hemolysin III family)